MHYIPKGRFYNVFTLFFSKWNIKSVIEEYIKHRYNRLNNDLKILLQKSSLLGSEFYSNQLQKTFNLVRVDEELSRIEKLSSLIQKNDNYDKNKYLFETEEVYFHCLSYNKIDD